MSEIIHISQATRGHYGDPIPLLESGINFINDEYEDIPMPSRIPCDHPQHWQNGKGTRNGQKLYYPPEKMYVQKWVMSKKEINQACKQWDMASLEMKPRIICEDCRNRL